jgi:hypothetical protein
MQGPGACPEGDKPPAELASLLAALHDAKRSHEAVLAAAAPRPPDRGMPRGGVDGTCADAKRAGDGVEPDEAVAVAAAMRRSRAEADPWQTKRGYDPWAFFPRNFQRFLLTGRVPRVIPTVLGPSSPAPVHPAPVHAKAPRVGFVVGCGRSGTSLMASLLSMRPGVVFLNEPRHLWLQRDAFPSLDVWSVQADDRGGTLVVPRCAASAAPRRAARARALLLSAAAVPSSPSSVRRLLLEKQPEHAFRMPFLRSDSLFPTARFVHVLRDPAAVVRSIGRMPRHAWHGATGRKWRRLRALARAEGFSERDLRRLEAEPDGAGRAEVEWTVTVRAARRGAAEIGRENVLEVRYEDVVRSPEATSSRVADFLGAPAPSAAARAEADALARAYVHRRGLDGAASGRTARAWHAVTRETMRAAAMA